MTTLIAPEINKTRTRTGFCPFDFRGAASVLFVAVAVNCVCVHSFATNQESPKIPRANWKADASEYFTDVSIQRACEAISSHDMARLREVTVGLDLNSRGRLNMSLPFWAYLEGNLEAIKFLLENGASPDHKLSADLRLRDGPVFGGTKDQNLIQHAFENMQTRQEFFRLGVFHTTSPNQSIIAGNSLLHLHSSMAMTKPDVNAVLRLIGKGADLNAKTTKGETACHLAARSNPCALLVLVLAGADWRIPYPDGTKLIDVVRKKSHPSDNGLSYHYLTVLYWLEEEVEP